MVNPLWLHTLVVVHETGSFTRAAEQLDLTQAAVSQHISRLETEFGPLLLRKPRQLELTPRGLVLLDFARQQAQSPCPPRAALVCCSIPCCSTSNRSTPDSPSSTALPPPPT